MRILILVLGLLGTFSISGKNLREISEKEELLAIYNSYLNSIQEYSIDSLSKLKIHVNYFKQDISLKESLGDGYLPSDFEDSWIEANRVQKTLFEFSPEYFDYEKDMSSYSKNDLFLLFAKDRGISYLVGITGGDKQHALFSIVLNPFDLKSKDDVELIMNMIQYKLKIRKELNLEGVTSDLSQVYIQENLMAQYRLFKAGTKNAKMEVPKKYKELVLTGFLKNNWYHKINYINSEHGEDDDSYRVVVKNYKSEELIINYEALFVSNRDNEVVLYLSSSKPVSFGDFKLYDVVARIYSSFETTNVYGG